MKGAVDKTAPMFLILSHGGNVMAEKKKGNIATRIAELVKDTVEECGCTLWDVEFVKEGPDHNLIIYIDKPEGISLTDCEMVNDAVEPIIDEADPIEGSYYLEISSPGLERELKTPEHITAFAGSEVIVKLFTAFDGKKTYSGVLSGYDTEKDTITVESGDTTVELERKQCSSIKTVCEF